MVMPLALFRASAPAPVALPVFAAALSIGFHALLRPSELLALRPKTSSSLVTY